MSFKFPEVHCSFTDNNKTPLLLGKEDIFDKLNITFTNQEIKLSRFKRVTKEKLIGSENVYLLSADTERGDDEDISPTLGAFALLSEEQYKQLFLVMKKAKAVKRK